MKLYLDEETGEENVTNWLEKDVNSLENILPNQDLKVKTWRKMSIPSGECQITFSTTSEKALVNKICG